MFGRPGAGILGNKRHERYQSLELNDSDLTLHQDAMKTKLEILETTSTSIRLWPVEARELKQYNWISSLYMFSDVVLSILPLYFILLGIAVITLNGKPTDGNSFGLKVEFALELGPTFFPIVFAAVGGRSMKMIARYLAERTGATLGTLELLMASQSVWGTVESQLLMQRLTFVGANLLFLWAMSPLGGQASLRLMNRGFASTESESKLRYLSTGPAASISPAGLGLYGRDADVSVLYGSVLTTGLSVALSPRDHLGNVKIPRLEALDVAQVDSDGWIQVPTNMTAPEMYSSLVGLPVIGLSTESNSSRFTMESTYLSLTCSPFVKRFSSVESPVKKDSAGYRSIRSFFFDTTLPSYGGSLFQKDNRDVLIGRVLGFIGHKNYNITMNGTTLNEEDLYKYRDITYTSLFALSEKDQMRQKAKGNFGLDTTLGFNIANCSISQTHVETLVDCPKLRCRADKIRRSRSDTRPGQFTGLDFTETMRGISESFPVASEAIGSSPTEWFIANTSSSPFRLKNGNFEPKNATYVDLSLLEPEIFSRRLSLTLNTFYLLAAYFFKLPQHNLSWYGPDTIPATDLDVYLPLNYTATNYNFETWKRRFREALVDVAPYFIGATTVANVTTVEEIFQCEFGWLALLLTCATTILFVGLTALLLKLKTVGPEIFGFVTSMTYNNPYINIPEGGGMLDAMERARFLRDMEVYIADVRGDDKVGKIALVAGVPFRRLERGRLYS